MRVRLSHLNRNRQLSFVRTCARYKIAGKCQDRHYYEHARSSAADCRAQAYTSIKINENTYVRKKRTRRVAKIASFRERVVLERLCI